MAWTWCKNECWENQKEGYEHEHIRKIPDGENSQCENIRLAKIAHGRGNMWRNRGAEERQVEKLGCQITDIKWKLCRGKMIKITLLPCEICLAFHLIAIANEPL